MLHLRLMCPFLIADSFRLISETARRLLAFDQSHCQCITLYTILYALVSHIVFNKKRRREIS